MDKYAVVNWGTIKQRTCASPTSWNLLCRHTRQLRSGYPGKNASTSASGLCFLPSASSLMVWETFSMNKDDLPAIRYGQAPSTNLSSVFCIMKQIIIKNWRIVFRIFCDRSSQRTEREGILEELLIYDANSQRSRLIDMESKLTDDA